MKKFLAFILGFVIAVVFSISACKGREIEGSFTFVVPDGAPALSIAKFINDDENFGTKATFSYSVVSSAEINKAITVDKADLVVMPLNAATKLYNADNDNLYKMAAVVTHGNFYVMSKTSISSVNDLIGRVVFVPNPGKVPDWTFKSALSVNGVEYVVSDEAVNGKVAIKYYNTPQEFNALLIQNSSAFGLVPEPAVSVLKSKGVNAVLDLQEVFDSQNKAYPQAVLMVKVSVCEEFPSLIEKIENAFNSNVEWVKQNPANAVNAIKNKFAESTLNASVISSETVEGCKIYYEKASVAKNVVNTYIERIRAIDEVSANLVGNDFYLHR